MKRPDWPIGYEHYHPGVRDLNIANDLVERIRRNNDGQFAEILIAKALCATRYEAAEATKTAGQAMIPADGSSQTPTIR